jgi:flagellar biosynthesis GTPase FlhF
MADKEENKPKIEKQSQESDSTIAKSEPSEIEDTTPETENGDSEQIISQIEKMPPSIRREIRSIFASFSQTSRPSYNPLFDKFTEAHIDKYLDYAQRDTDNDYELKKSNRFFYLIYAIIAVVVFSAGVVYLLPKDKDLLIQLIGILVIILGSAGGGYGLSKRSSQ